MVKVWACHIANSLLTAGTAKYFAVLEQLVNALETVDWNWLEIDPFTYQLFCMLIQKCVRYYSLNDHLCLRENPDLKSKPGDITKLLSENWKQLSEEEQRPYV